MFKDFKFAIPITRAYSDSEGTMFFEGIASSTSIDTYQTIFNRKCQDGFSFDILNGIERQEPVELEAEHLGDEEPMNILGCLINATVTEDDRLKVVARLDSDNPKAIYYYRKMTVPDPLTGKTKQFGLSINGSVESAHFEYNEELRKNVRVFDRVQLKRVGIVRKPSNPDSWVEKIIRSVDWETVEDQEVAERAYDGINFTPPETVQSQFKKGLKLYEEGMGGDGLVQSTISWARKLAGGAKITPEKARKMSAWHARHKVDKRPGWDKSGEETPGYVAFLLWGGESGKNWADRLVKAMEKMDNKETRDEEILESTTTSTEASDTERSEMTMEQLMEEVPGEKHHMNKLLELLTTIVEAIDTIEDMTEMPEEMSEEDVKSAAYSAMRKIEKWTAKRFMDAESGAASMKEDLSDESTMLTPMEEKRAEEEVQQEEQPLEEVQAAEVEEVEQEVEQAEVEERAAYNEEALMSTITQVISDKFNEVRSQIESCLEENKVLREQMDSMKAINAELSERLVRVESEPASKPAEQLFESVTRSNSPEARKTENIERAKVQRDAQELIRHKILGNKYIGYGEFV
jgi:hypothetical protein